LHRRGAGTLYRLSNKSFGFAREWGALDLSNYMP